MAGEHSHRDSPQVSRVERGAGVEQGTANDRRSALNRKPIPTGCRTTERGHDFRPGSVPGASLSITAVSENVGSQISRAGDVQEISLPEVSH